MPDAAHLSAFLAAALVLAVTPGPGIFYVLARSLGAGVRVGVRSTLGTAVGGMCHVAAAAIGLSALLMASATAYEIVKYAGAAYLLYLGLKMLLSSAEPVEAERTDGGAFRQGVLTELLNPKTALFFLTFLPQFTQPENGPVALQLLALGTFSVALNSGADLIVAGSAGRLSEVLRRRPRLVRGQRAFSGCALLTLGAYAATAERRQP
jgi:threonine/homoserine/homoserine lactone efflux protein